MAGWLTVLKLVPWQEVITNAPKVVDAATRLWKTTARKAPPTESAPVPAAQEGVATERPELAALQAQMAAADASIAELHQQMADSSRLIRELAAQNEQLVTRVEALRVRVLWLIVLMAALALAGVAHLLGFPA